MFGLTTFSANLIVNLTLQAIIIHNLYFPILFGCVTITFIHKLYPIRPSLRKFLEKKETGKYAIAYLFLISLIVYTDVLYFMFDPTIIFAKLDSRVITDKNALDYAINIQTLVVFIALPILSAYSFTLLKNKLVKEGYEIHDKFKNNWKFAALIIIINIAMYFLFIFITNHKI